jgi:hypothetical protein
MAEDEDLPLDVGDAKSVKEHSKEARDREKKRIEFLRTAMLREEGRIFFYDLLVATHCFRNPFSPEGDRYTAFNCGEMNIGLQVLADLNTHCTKEYLIMMEENRV